MQVQKNIHFVNQLSELEKLFSLTLELQKEFCLSEELVFSLNLSLEEALTNVILYAYPSTTGQIELLVDGQDDHLVFTLKDQGIPFNPLVEAPEADITSSIEDREIGGLGVFLIRQLMDEVEYTRQDESNILQMTKKIN